VASIGGALAPGELDLDGAIAMIRAVGVHDFFAGFLPQGSFAPGTEQTLIDRALRAASRDRDVEMVIDLTTTALSTDVSDIARDIEVPTMVVTGEVDMTCPVQMGRELADAMGTDLIVLPGRGHVVSMEAPEEMAALIAEHAARHDIG
jgi:pimeloyl-ACP methyl ester carboxylesterase